MVNATVDNEALTEFTYSSFKVRVTGTTDNDEGIDWGDSGSRMIVPNSNNSDVSQYDVSVPYNINNLTGDGSLDVSAQVGSPVAAKFGNNGNKLFVADSSSRTIQGYTLSTQWDVTTASADSSFTPGEPSGASRFDDFDLNSTGDVLLHTHANDENIYKSTLSTSWDLSTASYDTSTDGTIYSDVRGVNYVNSDDRIVIYLNSDSQGAVLNLPADNDISSFKTANRFNMADSRSGISWHNGQVHGIQKSGASFELGTWDPGVPLEVPSGQAYRVKLNNINGTMYLNGTQITVTGSYVVDEQIGISATGDNLITGLRIK